MKMECRVCRGKMEFVAQGVKNKEIVELYYCDCCDIAVVLNLSNNKVYIIELE